MKLSTQILLAFLLVLLLSITDSGSNYLLSLKVEKNIEFLNKSQEIVRNSTRLHKTMIEMQSSFRGFLLTQDDNFLDGYKNGLTSIPELLAEQEDLIKDNPTQMSILDSIKLLHHIWLAYADTLINAREIHAPYRSTDSYQFLFENRLKKEIGKNINDDISVKFSEFDRIEYGTRKMHSNNLIASIRNTHNFSLVFFVLTIVIGISTALYIVFRISKRIKTMVNFAENISDGHFTTIRDHSKDELTSLSRSLNKMSEKLERNISELENRNAELDKFAYVVSHDLKAPIRGIHNVINWTEEDLASELSPQMKKHLDIISHRAKRMEDLINGLLDYARVRRKTDPQVTNVNEIVYQISDSIVPRSFTVEVHDLPIFFTERSKLEQIFENLISNAVKYTPGKDGRIIINCKEYPDHYEFSVKDNGIGIDPEYHSRIFEMFQTLREKDEKESTGIGLAIIKRILDEQDCSIRIVSALGEGSEFIFTWPRNKN
ncbi:MAG TPA: ATP-binding protein [Chitinophagaceae bacterium]